MSLRCVFKMYYQLFCWKMFKGLPLDVQKKLSFRHPENILARCLATLTRQLLDILQILFSTLGKLDILNERNERITCQFQPFTFLNQFESFKNERNETIVSL